MSYETDIAYMRMEQNIQQTNEKIAGEAMRMGMDAISGTSAGSGEAMGGALQDPTGNMMQEMQQQIMEPSTSIEQSYDAQVSESSSNTESVTSEEYVQNSIQKAEEKIKDTAKDMAKAVVIIT